MQEPGGGVWNDISGNENEPASRKLNQIILIYFQQML